MNIQFVKVNFEAKDRESKWVLACPTCQYEREVSYCQIWNVKKGKSTGDCKKCAASKKEGNLAGLELGRKYHPNRKKADHSKNKVQMEIVNAFGNGFTKETRQKMREAKLGKRGEEGNNWQGGKTRERIRISSTTEYKNFRKSILARDNYKCVLCSSNKKLEVDHIKEWCNYPELRFESTNCRTLCKECHKMTDNYTFKAIKKKKDMAV